MVNIELLKKYGHYTRMPIRMPDQQDYTALLRQEMLRRIWSGYRATLFFRGKEKEKLNNIPFWSIVLMMTKIWHEFLTESS